MSAITTTIVGVGFQPTGTSDGREEYIALDVHSTILSFFFEVMFFPLVGSPIAILPPGFSLKLVDALFMQFISNSFLNSGDRVVGNRKKRHVIREFNNPILFTEPLAHIFREVEPSVLVGAFRHSYGLGAAINSRFPVFLFIFPV